MKRRSCSRRARLALLTPLALLPLLILFSSHAATHAADLASDIKLYTLDGGSLSFTDMSLFCDSGELDGKPGKMAVPAFLIRHPKGTLLWDSGLGDALIKRPQGVDMPHGIHASVHKTLVSQLSELGVAPRDVGFLAFSHLHGDHTGNANLFINATWIVSKKELAFAASKPTPIGVDPASISFARRAKLRSDEADIDVFGDGRVRILRAPGHTPDHRVLLLKLARSGTLLLSGDLYHTHESVKQALVPPNNVSRADTLASFDRVQKLIKQHAARLIVHHNLEDVASLPKLPAYLD